MDKLVKEGIQPPIFKSSNVDGGDEYNQKMFEKYYGYWKQHLRLIMYEDYEKIEKIINERG